MAISNGEPRHLKRTSQFSLITIEITGIIGFCSCLAIYVDGPTTPAAFQPPLNEMKLTMFLFHDKTNDDVKYERPLHIFHIDIALIYGYARLSNIRRQRCVDFQVTSS